MNGLTRKGHPADVRLPRLFESFFGGDPFGNFDLATRPAPGGLLSSFEFAPSFEVKENDAGYVVKADVPGVAEKDLSITLHENVLRIEGHRAEEKEHKAEDKEGDSGWTHVSERAYGSFVRSFVLPDKADASAVDANMKDGVLTVTVAKKADVQPRKVTVKTK